MNSIVLDLEWNQAQTRDREAPGLTFEVIEIGAVRLDEHGNQTDSFSCLIRPCVYTELFYRVREVVGISMKQLEAECICCGIPVICNLQSFDFDIFYIFQQNRRRYCSVPLMVLIVKFVPVI